MGTYWLGSVSLDLLPKIGKFLIFSELTAILAFTCCGRRWRVLTSTAMVLPCYPHQRLHICDIINSLELSIRCNKTKIEYRYGLVLFSIMLISKPNNLKKKIILKFKLTFYFITFQPNCRILMNKWLKLLLKINSRFWIQIVKSE